MRYIFNLVILFILLSGGINLVSAANERTTFSRMLYVSEWGGILSTQAGVDKVIADAVYMNADAITLGIESNYFEAASDTVNKGTWDTRTKASFSNIGLPFLEYFIKKAHENNIEVHAWVDVNIVGSASNSKYKLFGPSAGFPYNEVTQAGSKTTNPDSYYRLDIAFKEFQDYEIGLWSWVAASYPELDGLHFEEPFYDSYSYSTAMRERVNTKFGYDPMYSPGKTQGQVEADMAVVQREAWNEFFTGLKNSIDAVNANRARKIQLSANSVGYGPIRGFDPKYMSDNRLLDWYAEQTSAETLSEFKSAIEYGHAKVTQIPFVAGAFVTYSGIGGRLNNAVIDQIRYAYDYGADGLYIFNWNYIDIFGKINGQDIREILHNIIPPPGNSVAAATPTPASTPTPMPIPTPNANTNTSTISNPGFEWGTGSWYFFGSETGTFNIISRVMKVIILQGLL